MSRQKNNLIGVNNRGLEKGRNTSRPPLKCPLSQEVIPMDINKTYEKQIQMLEKVQEQAFKDGDMKKVEELAISIISINNSIKSGEA